MNAQPHESNPDMRRKPTKAQRGLELAIFVLASLVGITGIGKGLAGFYERGQEISLLWLAVTGIAFFVLFAQMGRVHDTWPHRPGKITPKAPAIHGSPNTNDASSVADAATTRAERK
jgi:hypothetical protein